MNFTEERIQHPRNVDFEDAAALFRLLRDAAVYGLEFECAEDFIRAIRTGSTAAEASWHARCEWDL